MIYALTKGGGSIFRSHMGHPDTGQTGSLLYQANR